MTRLVILGSACAVADSQHANAQLALMDDTGVVLVDCAGAPSQRLEKAGIEINDIDDVILTHFHPDHVAGIPLLLMDMWLTGRKKPLRIYGLHHCLERIEAMMGYYEWENWPGFFTVAFHRLPEREQVVVLEKGGTRILSSPVEHVIPTIGLRFDRIDGSGSIAYSCDTEPSEKVVRLGHKADMLLHEATGEGPGHSSARQAGQIATQAEVDTLVLIHYPVRDFDPEVLVGEAAQTFDGEIRLARDLMALEF
ncbi:MAG: MBL fold metallo-hydrolase [Anaerolineales bacterium]|jgi:ribonuclease Z